MTLLAIFGKYYLIRGLSHPPFNIKTSVEQTDRAALFP